MPAALRPAMQEINKPEFQIFQTRKRCEPEVRPALQSRVRAPADSLI
jgi:hypothetical protein